MNEMQIAIYIFDLDMYFYLLEDKELFSTSQEREEAEKYTAPKKSYKLLSYMIRRIVLSKALKCEPLQVKYCYGKNSKPFISKSKLSFSVSHSGKYFLIGLTLKKAIGVDIEIVKYIPKHNSFLNTYCSKEQKKEILCYGGHDKLTQTFVDWCLKESFSKARGFGVKEDFKKLIFEFRGNDLQREDTENEEYLLNWYIEGNYIPSTISNYNIYSFYDNDVVSAITIIDDEVRSLPDISYHYANPDLLSQDLIPSEIDYP